ncbi:MAG: class I SAM-dependent methyltransferase [Anaerolineae bacterium]|nr:class I SAM-dependent methyltransferase [Anaerolineae bacterium]
MLEEITCILCGTADTKYLYSGYDLWRASSSSLDRELFRVVQCTKCGLVYINPRIHPDCIAGHYPEDYVAYSGQLAGPREPRAAALSHRLRRELFLQATGWAKPALPLATLLGLLSKTVWAKHAPLQFRVQGLRMLDIGCGVGNFLAVQRSLGWDVWGVEPSYIAAQVCASRGLRVKHGQLDGTEWSEGFFDAVVLHQVLEHVADPQALLPKVHRLLRRNGLVQIDVPNFRSVAARLFGQFWIGADIPRHYFLFSPRTLRKLLMGSGFEVKRWYTCSSTSGFTAAIEFILRERCGLTVRRDAVRKNRLLCRLFQPIVRLTDLLNVGDVLYVVASRSR